jgi:hypothetical protein
MRPQVTRLHRQFVSRLSRFARTLAHRRGRRADAPLHIRAIPR